MVIIPNSAAVAFCRWPLVDFTEAFLLNALRLRDGYRLDAKVWSRFDHQLVTEAGAICEEMSQA
jgi:hypothetical protein